MISITHKFIFSFLLSVLLVACTCNQPYKVKPVERGDKKLTCPDVILELNEAEYRKKQAMSAKGISADQALLPLCWLPTYTSAQEAQKAADERIEYLTQIYNVLQCDRKKRGSARTLPPPPPIRKQATPPRQRRILTPPPFYGGQTTPPTQ